MVVRVADQIGGGLETGCMVWTGQCSKSLPLFCHVHVADSFSPCSFACFGSFESGASLESFDIVPSPASTCR